MAEPTRAVLDITPRPDGLLDEVRDRIEAERGDLDSLLDRHPVLMADGDHITCARMNVVTARLHLSRAVAELEAATAKLRRGR